MEVGFNHARAELERKGYAFGRVLRREVRFAPVRVNVDCLGGERARREHNRACGGDEFCR